MARGLAQKRFPVVPRRCHGRAAATSARVASERFPTGAHGVVSRARGGTAGHSGDLRRHPGHDDITELQKTFPAMAGAFATASATDGPSGLPASRSGRGSPPGSQRRSYLGGERTMATEPGLSVLLLTSLSAP